MISAFGRKGRAAAAAEAPATRQDPNAAVPPGGVIGILGGGQLGRMLAIAAAKLGLKTHVYAPEAGGPAADVAAAFTQGSADYERGLADFARACHVVTLEFENVPAAALDIAAQAAPVRPGRRALETAQDRIVEKTFLSEIGAPVTGFRAIDSVADIEAGLMAFGGSAILKTRRFGYDGRGQARIAAASPDEIAASARAAYAEIGEAPAILEAVAAFRREISVIVARGTDGATAAYDPSENTHENGILRRSIVATGAISEETAARAQAIASEIVERLDYVGVMGVEMFEMPGGALLVNEVAPRVHNTGHWTLEACAVSQFEQHIRAVAGWPLGGTTRHSDAAMTNLIGEEALDWAELAANPDLAVHLYGKDEARPGRKMGHVTRLLRPSWTR